jgi:two-component system, OmpR family, sensor histidine kinase CpxA
VRRLIFAWFLFSLTLLIGMLVGAAFWTGPSAFRVIGKHFARGLLVYAARQAAFQYEQGGREALVAFQKQTQPSAETQAVFYDIQGQNLLPSSRPTPKALEAFAANLTGAEDPEIEIVAGIARFAVRTQTNSGNTFTLAFQAPAKQLLWSLIDWPTMISRILFVLALGILVCSWLATKISRPLADLRMQTQRFASGDLGARSTKGLAMHIPEIAALATDFDHMGERIESLVRSQQHLLHYVSHELRTPLTRLQLAIGLAQNHATPETLQRIAFEGDRLNELIDQILRYSQLESASTKPLAVQPIDWRDFLESIAADASFEAEAQQKQVTLAHVDGGRFEGDRDLLRSAFENVIRNAIRHSPTGGSVEIEQRAHDGESAWTVLINDSGPGVPESQIGRIFEPFYRAPAANNKSSGSGYGLGLAIAHQAATLHKAQLLARNRPQGGLTVEFRFPRSV